MWEVYIIQSIKFKRFYISYSQNAKFRLENYHNKGLCKSTKAYLPYIIIKIEKYNNKTEALERERQIKKMKGGSAFKNLVKQW